jgi:hypothetical protein
MQAAALHGEELRDQAPAGPERGLCTVQSAGLQLAQADCSSRYRVRT